MLGTCSSHHEMVAYARTASLWSLVQLPADTQLPDASRMFSLHFNTLTNLPFQYVRLSSYAVHLVRLGHSSEVLWLPWVVVRQRQSRQLRGLWQCTNRREWWCKLGSIWSILWRQIWDDVWLTVRYVVKDDPKNGAESKDKAAKRWKTCFTVNSRRMFRSVGQQSPPGA
jgi:hypothetical protein